MKRANKEKGENKNIKILGKQESDGREPSIIYVKENQMLKYVENRVGLDRVTSNLHNEGQGKLLKLETNHGSKPKLAAKLGFASHQASKVQ